MATVRKRTWANGTQEAYCWRYKDAGGKIRQYQHHNKHVVEAFKRKTEQELEAGIHVAARASITIAQAAALYLEDVATRIGAVTLENYETLTRNYIVPKLGAKRLVDLTGPTLQYYVDNLVGEGFSPNQIHKAKMVLGQIVTFSARRGLVGHNIVRSAPPLMPRRHAEEMPIPTKDELHLILAQTSARKEHHGFRRLRTRALIHLAMLTGLRQGEIRGLLWSNVDLEEGTVHVRQSLDKWCNVKKPKTAKGTRSVPMSPTLCRLLKEWKLAQPPNPTDYVFATKFGGPMGPSAVASLWMVHLYHCGLTHWPEPDPKPLIGEKAKYGMPNYRFHDLRHVCASLWIEQGISLKALQVYIGHASVQMTLDRYGHLLASRDEAGAAVFKAADQMLPAAALQFTPSQ